MLPASESKQASPANNIFQQFVTPPLSSAADALGRRDQAGIRRDARIMGKRIIEMGLKC
jgi:hypothetical protein